MPVKGPFNQKKATRVDERTHYSYDDDLGPDGDGSATPLPGMRTEVQDIRLYAALQHLWVGRRLLVRFALVFFVLGILFILGSRREYESEASLLPEKMDESALGAGKGLLKEFGSLLGVGGEDVLDQKGGALPVEIYPDILKSMPVKLALLDQEIFVPSLGETVTLYVYMDEHLPFSLWAALADAAGDAMLFVRDLFGGEPVYTVALGEEIVHLSRRQLKIAESLDDRLDGELDKKTDVLTVTVEMPDALVAAQTAEFAVEKLTRYITDYRLKKLTTDLEFLEGRHAESQERFNGALEALARFRDRNRNIVQNQARTEEQRLQAEFDLAFSMYSTLGKTLEEARLKVQEQTPVFQVLEPVQVPLRKSFPQTKLTLVLALLLGLIVGAAYLLLRPDFVRLRQSLRHADRTTDRTSAVAPQTPVSS